MMVQAFDSTLRPKKLDCAKASLSAMGSLNLRVKRKFLEVTVKPNTLTFIRVSIWGFGSKTKIVSTAYRIISCYYACFLELFPQYDRLSR